MGDHVFLKVMPKKGVVRFAKRGQLWLRFIGPFERVGTVAYRLALPPKLSGVHMVFHVSMLQKYTPYPTHMVDWGELIVDADGTFKEGTGFARQDREASERVVTTPRSGGANMGTRRHYTDQLSFLI